MALPLKRPTLAGCHNKKDAQSRLTNADPCIAKKSVVRILLHDIARIDCPIAAWMSTHFMWRLGFRYTSQVLRPSRWRS
jgi:hypothetical protein